MTPTPDVVLSQLGFAVLKREARSSFVPLWDVPSWCARLGPAVFRVGVPCAIADVLPFFELFLHDAEVVWSQEKDGRLDSQGFAQVLADGTELRLFATALRSGDLALLIIFQNEQAFTQEQLLLQRARELRAAHDALSREIEQRDVLTHCVVHDLRNPLAAILGALEVLQRAPLRSTDAQLLALARDAAHQQASLISDILTAFSDRETARGARELARTDLASVVRHVTSMLEPTARARGVRIEVRINTDAEAGPASRGASGPLEVLAEPLRLFRVIGNLLENALRYSAPDAVIHVAVEVDQAAAQVSIEDEGPGVPAGFVPFLFQKFARTESPSGTGLGLYFCRITVEDWGGAIGYEPRSQRGSRFWFRLPRSAESRPQTPAR